MKKNLLVFVLVISFLPSLFAQSGVLQSPKNPTVKRGFIYYPNGSRLQFSQLRFVKDSVTFFTKEKMQLTESLEQIDSLSKTYNGAGRGALWGTGGGFAAGYITSLIFFTKWGDENGVIYDSSDEEKLKYTIKREGWNVIVICTVAGAAIGALAGLQDRLEKTVYRRNPSVDVFPGFSYMPNEQPVFTVNIHIRL